MPCSEHIEFIILLRDQSNLKINIARGVREIDYNKPHFVLNTTSKPNVYRMFCSHSQK